VAFALSIFYQGYLGYPSWSLYQNGKWIALIDQASDGTQYINTLGAFITPAKAGDTFQWQLNFDGDSSPPVMLNSPGCFWQGLMIAPGHTAE